MSAFGAHFSAHVLLIVRVFVEHSQMTYVFVCCCVRVVCVCVCGGGGGGGG